jgi:hypothetical protein
MAANTSSNPAFVYDNIRQNPTKVITSGNYTVGPNDNYIVAGGNSHVITLDSNSNSPVYISSVDGVTQRTGTTILITTLGVTQDWVIADSGCAALCTRVGPASTNEWAIIGAKTCS